MGDLLNIGITSSQRWKKFPLLRSSGMVQIRNISLKAQAVISHHVRVPTPSVTFFHYLYVLVEAFSLLITYVTKVGRKLLKMAEQEMSFYAHIAAKHLIGCQHLVHYFPEILGFFCFQGSFQLLGQRTTRLSSQSWSWNSLSLIILRI